MIYKSNKVEKLKIAYIGGGSRGWAWNLMSDLAVQDKLSGTVHLYDIDHERAMMNEKIGNEYNNLEGCVSSWEYRASEKLSDALKNADFVVISILPGTFDEMESDVHTPEKYGILQPVGDTTGPGGILRALRAIPMFEVIAKGIKKYCPKAWVINYTNPMTMCTQTLYEVFPQIKAFGCCHEVFGTQKMLAAMLERTNGIKAIQRQDIKTNVLGINHFTWLDKVYYRNINVIDIYKDFVEENYEKGFDVSGKANWLNSYFHSENRVKFDLFKRYGLIAAAGDRHLSEFVPGWYLKDRKMVKDFTFSLTPVSWRKKQQKELREKAYSLYNGDEKVEIKESGEEGVKQMTAILGLGDFVTNVNVPNRGQIKSLPEAFVVETNACFRNNEVSPVMAGEMPDNVNNLVIRHIYNYKTVIEAALNRDLNLALTAFINDPLVSKIDIYDAKKLFWEMVENTKEYLSEY